MRFISKKPFLFWGLLLGFLMFILHLFMPIFGDDLRYITQSHNHNFFDVISYMYNNWSSRVIIEAVLWIVGKNFWIWKLLDITVVLLLYYFIIKIFGNKNDGEICKISMLCIFIYPFWHMATTGHMAAAVNYLWPLVSGFIVGYGSKKSFLGQKIRMREYPIYICSLILASNFEQLNIFLLGMFSILIFYNILQKKRFNYYLLTQLLIVFVMLIFILKCPGNDVRYLTEMKNRFPDFELLGFLGKIQLGFSSTISHFIISPNILFPVFCFLLYLTIRLQYSNILYRIISLIPLIVYILSLITNIYYSYNSNIFSWIEAIMSLKTGTIIIDSSNYYNIINYIPIFVFTICCLSILISIYLCFKKDSWFYISLIILGFISRAVMGFSPTIWASSYRTFIILYFVFIICIISFYKKLRELGFNYKNIVFIFISNFFIIISYLCNFAGVAYNIIRFR